MTLSAGNRFIYDTVVALGRRVTIDEVAQAVAAATPPTGVKRPTETELTTSLSYLADEGLIQSDRAVEAPVYWVG